MNKARLKEWQQTILKDEFDDQAQNKSAYGERVSGWSTLVQLEALSWVRSPILDIGCGSGNPPYDPLMSPDAFLDPSPMRAARDNQTKEGFAEDLPYPDKEFGHVRLWGTWCFLRSHVETMMEVNRVLKKDGTFIFDIVTHTTMPLAQTHNGDSFINWMSLFGFKLQAQIEFGPSHHRRLGIRAQKTRDFDFRFFRMPQSSGGIRNYLPERDWYMQ